MRNRLTATTAAALMVAAASPRVGADPATVLGAPLVTIGIDLPTAGSAKNLTLFVSPLSASEVRVVGVECRPTSRDHVCVTFDETRRGSVTRKGAVVRLVVATAFGVLDVTGKPVISPSPSLLTCEDEGGFEGNVAAAEYGAVDWRGRIGRTRVAAPYCSYVVERGIGVVT